METFINNSYYIFAKDIITFLFTGTGLVIAGMGLATWKKQIKGVKEFETAHDLRYSILKLRNAIRNVRNPVIWPSESYQAMQDYKIKYPNKLETDAEKDSHAYVYEIRWKAILAATAEMESHLLAAEVLWGPEILSLIKPLNKEIGELNISLRQYFQPELRTKDFMELHNVIYYKGDYNEDGTDDFDNRVLQAIDGVTSYIKNKIS
ncbi:MAG: hypothetical protein NUV90_01935 [Candidatus Parcubacteria bacterium]|nr:hypothetical protein [Candidatus Parcubacteria bacterium]